MIKEKQAKKPGRHDPRKLGMWNRAMCNIFGLAGLGSGGAAVYITDQEAGPVALIAAGVIFLIIGMGGRLPNRLKFGDNEAEWMDEAGEALANAVENAPPDAKADLIATVNTLSETMPRITQASFQAIAFEAIVFNMMAEIAAADPEVGLVVSHEPRFGFDAELLGPTGKKAVVEIKGGRHVSRQQIERINENFMSVPNRHGAEKILVILRDMPQRDGDFAQFPRYPYMSVVQVKGPDDTEALRQAIRQLIVDGD